MLVALHNIVHRRSDPSCGSPRVLIIGNFLSASVGIEGVCEHLAVRLQDSGCAVFTASSHRKRITRLFDMLQVCWNERNNFDVAQVDVYSGWSFVWAEAVCSVLRLLKKPCVLTLHGGNLPLFAKRYPRRVIRLLETADAVTTPSSYLQTQMQAYCGCLQLLPNAIDVGAYRFRMRRPARPCLVWLRAFHKIYNPSLAVRSFALLSKEVPNASLTMVGPDKCDGTFKAVSDLLACLGIEDRVVIRAGVPKCEVPQLLNEGDIFINTSRVDNTPVTVLEAMACGMCVVSTAVGGIPYLIRHGTDGLLIPSDDPKALASAVMEILNNPALAEKLSRNARGKVEQFDWSGVLPQWHSLLTSVLGKRGLTLCNGV